MEVCWVEVDVSGFEVGDASEGLLTGEGDWFRGSLDLRGSRACWLRLWVRF